MSNHYERTQQRPLLSSLISIYTLQDEERKGTRTGNQGDGDLNGGERLQEEGIDKHRRDCLSPSIDASSLDSGA